jgi:hypothetical protein
MNLLITMILSIFISMNANKYWNDFSENEKKQIIQSGDIPGNAIKLYYDKFFLSDDRSTEELLVYLTSNYGDTDVKAFKFYLFNKIVTSSDGALLEVLPEYVLKMILSDTPYVLDYFMINSKLKDTYSMLLGTEFYFKECEASTFPYTFNQFKKEIDSRLNSNKYDEILSSFYNKIQAQIDDMD